MNRSISVIHMIYVTSALASGFDQSHAALETASFLRWSMNTWRLTSSVRIGAPDSCRHIKKE